MDGLPNNKSASREPLRLLIRVDDRIEEAPESDQVVAQKYEAFAEKGVVSNGVRLTILAAKATYHVGEQVRVIHVLESTRADQAVYTAGPKRVVGEFVDGRLMTGESPENEDPWVPLFYDGPMRTGPAVDANYAITSYTFEELGMHTVYWQLGSIKSNVLRIRVE